MTDPDDRTNTSNNNQDNAPESAADSARQAEVVLKTPDRRRLVLLVAAVGVLAFIVVSVASASA